MKPRLCVSPHFFIADPVSHPTKWSIVFGRNYQEEVRLKRPINDHGARAALSYLLDVKPNFIHTPDGALNG